MACRLTASFKLIAEDMHDHYHDMLSKVIKNSPTVLPNFKNNPFAAATFNLGSKVSTKIHTNHLNYAPGWCAVIPLGDFNYCTSRRLVL